MAMAHRRPVRLPRESLVQQNTCSDVNWSTKRDESVPLQQTCRRDFGRHSNGSAPAVVARFVTRRNDRGTTQGRRCACRLGHRAPASAPNAQMSKAGSILISAASSCARASCNTRRSAVTLTRYARTSREAAGQRSARTAVLSLSPLASKPHMGCRWRRGA